MAGIFDYKRFLNLFETTQDVRETFPQDQYKYTYDFDNAGSGWTASIDWATLVVDVVSYVNGVPNLSRSSTLGYFEGGSANQVSSGLLSFPADMYSGPILPDGNTNVPVTVVNILWTRGDETKSRQLLLIQNWEPGTEIGDPTLDPDFIPLDSFPIQVEWNLVPQNSTATGTVILFDATATSVLNSGTAIVNTVSLRVLPSTTVQPDKPLYRELGTSTLFTTNFDNGLAIGQFIATDNFVDSVITTGTSITITTSTLTATEYRFTGIVQRSHRLRLEWLFDKTTRHRGGVTSSKIFNASTSRSFTITGTNLGIVLTQETEYQRINTFSYFTVTHTKGGTVTGDVTFNAVFTPEGGGSTSTVFIGTATFNSSGVATVGIEFLNTGTYVVQAYYAGNLGSSVFPPQYLPEFSNTVSQIVQVGIPLQLSEVIIEEGETSDTLYFHAVDNGISTGEIGGTVRFYRDSTFLAGAGLERYRYLQGNPGDTDRYIVAPGVRAFNSVLPQTDLNTRINVVGITNLDNPGRLPLKLNDNTYGKLAGFVSIYLLDFIETVNNIHYFYFAVDATTLAPFRLRQPDEIRTVDGQQQRFWYEPTNGEAGWYYNRTIEFFQQALFSLLNGDPFTDVLYPQGIQRQYNQFLLFVTVPEVVPEPTESMSHLASIIVDKGVLSTGTISAHYSGSTSTAQFLGYYPEIAYEVTATTKTFSLSPPLYLDRIWTRTAWPFVRSGFDDQAFNTQWIGQNTVNIPAIPINITQDSLVTLSTTYDTGSVGAPVTLRAHPGQNNVPVTMPYYKKLGRLQNRTKFGSVFYKNFDTLGEITSATLVESVTNPTLLTRTIFLPTAPGYTLTDLWDSQVHLPEFLRDWKYSSTSTARTQVNIMDIAQTSSFTTSTATTVSVNIAGYFDDKVTSTTTYSLQFVPKNTITFNSANTATLELYAGILTIPAANMQVNLNYALTVPAIEYPGISDVPTNLVSLPYVQPLQSFNVGLLVEFWNTSGTTLIKQETFNYDAFRGYNRPREIARTVGRIYNGNDISSQIPPATYLVRIYQIVTTTSEAVLRRNSPLLYNLKAIRLTSQTGSNRFDLTTLYSA